MTSVTEQAERSLLALAVQAQVRGDLPSLVAATFVSGRVAWQAGLGEVGKQYRIGSITKTFTAVEVMRLRDAGHLDLDDPIGMHVDDAPYADHSIRRLLAHSSGLTAEPRGPWWERSPGGSWQQLVNANTPPRPDVYPAGVRYHYSNLGYGLLGELVARVRGRSWFDSVSGSLLEPLGLAETTQEPRTEAAVGTSTNPCTGHRVREPAHDTGAMASAGQLWSTSADLARWGDFLATGDDRILGLPTLVEMRTAQSADPDTQHRRAYGLGIQLEWVGEGTLIGHTGSMPGFLAGLFVHPATRVGAVTLTNATTGLRTAELAAAMIKVVADGLPALPMGQPATSPVIAELTGAWFWGNTELSLTPASEGFVLSEDGVQRRFVTDGRDRFRGVSGYFAGEALRVVRTADNSISHLEVVTFIFTRSPYDEGAPIPGGPPLDISSPG